MSKILGIDLGTNSIGWAIVEQIDNNNNKVYSLIDKGVNIFQEGVKNTKSGEEPMVKERTDARALRRHYFRRKLRKIELLKVLIRYDFCPFLSQKLLDEWRYKKLYPLDDAFINWLRTNDDCNPYFDRYIALNKKLNLDIKGDRYMLGRAFYHLAQRRGFLSNRKDTSSTDDGVVKGAIKTLDEDMQTAGCNYLGEFYYKLYLEGKKVRTGNGYGYAGRIIHYEKEFNSICNKQQLSSELRKALYKAIFFQRPLKSQKGLVGTCTFERGKARCPISHPRFEEFRMYSLINNIKIKGPNDCELRNLTSEEVALILPLFYRKSKEHFDFEDIAKKLSGGKKDNYGNIYDKAEFAYKFNYKMTQTVSGCPMTAALRSIFGEDWLTTICSVYQKATNKNEEQILNDVWHVLFSFDNDDKLQDWAKNNLQLDDEQALNFVKIPVKQGYAALSLKAINKILPWLRIGYRYDEAVFIANLPDVVPSSMWDNKDMRNAIIRDVCTILDNYTQNPQFYRTVNNTHATKMQTISNMLLDNYNINSYQSSRLYEPSRIETYAKSQPNNDGLRLLGSPRTSSIRNPMAMRALFRLRALINQLLKEKKITADTKINIEFARELNDANKRSAIYQYQRENEKKRNEYINNIRQLYKEETGQDIEPTENDILKYHLWEEQKTLCIYTGKTIAISEFIGANPAYDIEHTVPRSRGGDNSQANKTLCQCHFNRFVKKTKLPTELDNYKDIEDRIKYLGWEEEIEKLEKKIESCKRLAKSAVTKESKDKSIKDRHYYRMRLDYLRDKLSRFKMIEVPEGFSKRQGVDIGIIGKYAKMYLETAFNQVHTVKGATTADFRKMWGLQEEYSKKERVNHVHHCIDAITIACISNYTYAKWAQYQCDEERYYMTLDKKPLVEKPWPTFTEDVKAIADELLVTHYTANILPKHTRKKLRIRGKVQYNAQGQPKYIQGDTARAVLHQQTFYGAIKRDDKIKYVVRKSLDALSSTDIDNIVDDSVKKCVRAAIKRERFNEAMSKPICFNEAKGVYIKKVRIYTPTVTNPIHLKKHRNLSRHTHKQEYHVTNDGNYCMALYEGSDKKGKIRRNFALVNNLDAAKFYNGKTGQYDIVPQSDENDYPLKYILKTGTMVLFYQDSAQELKECTSKELSKRLYKVVGLSSMLIQQKYLYGILTLKFHQEAGRPKDLKPKNGLWSINEIYRPIIVINHNQFNALVEGYDFELTVTGEIKFKY